MGQVSGIEQQSAARRMCHGHPDSSPGPLSRALTAVLASRLYPLVLQVPFLILFGLITYFGFFGTIRPGRNFGTVMTWTLWWPILPITLFLFGRVWCAVCPLATVSSLVQRIVHPTRLPGRFLRRYGVALMIVTFVGVTWADRTWTITRSPRATGILLLALLGGAILVSLLYQRRAWCRYICPIGALTGIYATTSVLELRAKEPTCTGCLKDCYKGNNKAEGCPLYQFPSTMDSNRDCNLCGNCVKACPQGYISVSGRPPGRELWRLTQPMAGEALLAVVMVPMVFMQTFDMSAAWGGYMRWMVERVGIDSYLAVFTITFFASIAIAVGLYGLASLLGSDTRRTWGKSLALFGYAFIPLALAGHIAHNISHLVTEGPRGVQTSLSQVGLHLNFVAQSGEQLMAVRPMLPLTLSVLAVGIAGSFFVLWRLGRKEGGNRAILAHGTVLLVATGLFLWLFLLPMNPTHSH